MKPRVRRARRECSSLWQAPLEIARARSVKFLTGKVTRHSVSKGVKEKGSASAPRDPSLAGGEKFLQIFLHLLLERPSIFRAGAEDGENFFWDRDLEGPSPVVIVLFHNVLLPVL